MTLYLRNSKNESVVDIELYEKENYVELHSVICIKPYSELLLEISNNRVEEYVQMTINTFDDISELRGWLWESYFMGRQNNRAEYPIVLQKVKEILKKVADEYGLYLVTD